MVTLNEFLEKALVNEGELVGDKEDKTDEAVNKAFADQLKKDGMEGGPGRYRIFLKVNMNFKADSMDDAMAKASDFANSVERQGRKYGAIAEIDGVDGP